MPEIEGWITTEEAEQVSGVSRSTLYIYRLTGKIRAQKFARAVMYWREDCEQVAREQEEKARKRGDRNE